MYKRNINKDKGKWLSRNNASGVVFFSIFIHMVLILQLCKYFFGRKLNFQNLSENKSIEILLGLFCMLFTFWYYSETRINNLEKKYANTKSIDTVGGWLVACSIFAPLLFVIILGWKR